MGTPLVSVIMGVYNADEHLLDASIRSLLTQTYENLEIIICDDASTNGTSEWLAKFAMMDERIRLLHNPTNQHLAGTLNHCIREARGEYLARQDADDISEPDRIEKQVAYLQEHEDIDFVGSNCRMFNPQSGVLGIRLMPGRPDKSDFLFNSPYIHGSLMFRSSCLNPDCCYLVSKWTDRTEDYELFMRMYSMGYQGANMQEPLYNYHYGAQQRQIAMHYRIDEMVLRYRGFQALGLLPKGLPYVVKPVVLGIMPGRLVSLLREKRMKIAVAS